MGLFDLFKKNSPKKRIEKLPPSMREAFHLLFPNGMADHDRQIDALYKHFNKRIPVQDIESNLIFILAGYLITGNIESREAAIDSVLRRPGTQLSAKDAEYFHDFALDNHPKLSVIAAISEIESMMGNDGCETDTIPGGHGKFGLSIDNPIPVKGVSGIYDYLSRLYDDCEMVAYTRNGTAFCSVSNHPVDVFVVRSSSRVADLYFSAYHKRTSQLAPSGYVLVDENKVVISSDFNSIPKGYRMTPQSNTLPVLSGTMVMACLSEEDLKGRPEELIRAERLNKKAIAQMNQNDVENALTTLDEAMSLGSLNSVNGKFTILHGEQRYKEALQHLQNAIKSQHATMTTLYNMAVLNYNGELFTCYNLEHDTARAYALLLRASNMKDDGREVLWNSTKKMVNNLIAKIEEEDPSLLEIKESVMATVETVTENEVDIECSTEIQKATPYTDIYGTNLYERMSDIYFCIQAGAEEMKREMVRLPEVSCRGALEMEILMAAVLSNNVDKGIVIQSLLSGNSEFRTMGASRISWMIDSYLRDHKVLAPHDDYKQRTPLMAFARTHGKLKLATIKSEDEYENIKIPVFLDEYDNLLRCKFIGFSKEEQEAEFIIRNKESIIVEETLDGEYLFRKKWEIDGYEALVSCYEDFITKSIAYKIYCTPLEYEDEKSSEEVDKGLDGIRKKPSNVVVVSNINDIPEDEFGESKNICPDINYALNEGIRSLECIASSLGIIN